MENNFANNLKHIRIEKGLTQQQLANKLGRDYSTIGKWELGQRTPVMNDIMKLSEVLDVPLIDLISTQYKNFDDVKQSNSILIAVYGIIRAGVPLEAQQDITDYIDIPKSWLKGGREYFALKISGDSMMPKYSPGDIVIFEKCYDKTRYNNKDCVVMVNSSDATFKTVVVEDTGILLTPINMNNTDMFMPKFYTEKQVKELPINILGFAVERRTKI